MGKCTSRTSLQTNKHPSQTSSSNPTSDPEYFNKLHKDTHYNAMDIILNRHLTLMDSNVDIQQTVTNIHKNALNIAMRQHINAMNSGSPKNPPAQQTFYIFLNSI